MDGIECGYIMCCRKTGGFAEQDVIQECSQCGVKDIVLHEDGERVLCDLCFRVRHREQKADDDLILPPPGYDIEEVGRQ